MNAGSYIQSDALLGQSLYEYATGLSVALAVTRVR